MTTVYFAGGEADALLPSVNAVENTNAGRFQSAYCRLSLGFNTSATGADYWEAALVDPSTQAYTSVTTAYIHAEIFTPNAAASGAGLIQMFDSSGTIVFRILRDASGNYQASFWNGSTYTNVGSAVVLTGATFYVWDLKIVCGASGTFEWYVNNSLQTSGSVTSASTDNIKKLRFYPGFTSQANMGWSQIFVTDEYTIGWHLYQKPPTSDSAVNFAWSGTFADVDEAVTNDADFTASTTAGDVETYKGGAFTFASGVVKAVIVSMRGKVAATGPQNIQGALRLGSTNYFSSNLPAYNAGFGPNIAVFPTDPSTGIDWTTAAAAAAATEFGMKSIA